MNERYEPALRTKLVLILRSSGRVRLHVRRHVRILRRNGREPRCPVN